jgi:hypothetical protein
MGEIGWEGIAKLVAAGLAGVLALFAVLVFLLIRRLIVDSEPGNKKAGRIYVAIYMLVLTSFLGLHVWVENYQRRQTIEVTLGIMPVFDDKNLFPHIRYQGVDKPLREVPESFTIANGADVTLRVEKLWRETQRYKDVAENLRTSLGTTLKVRAEKQNDPDYGVDEPQ